MHVPQSQSPFSVQSRARQPAALAPGAAGSHLAFTGQAAPPSSHGMGPHRPVVSSHRWPSAQGVPGHDGTQNEQHPKLHQPSVQSASVPHSLAHPAPPQMSPIVHEPHAQSASATQSSAVGSNPVQ
jgi:hypothetical protein